MWSGIVEAHIKGIQVHEVDELWGDVWPLLNKAEEYNAGVPITEQDTLAAIKNKDVQAWVCVNNSGNIDLAFTTTIYETPFGKTLEIVAVGGKNLDKWLWVLDFLSDWAQKLGCKRLLTSGRLGWTKVLRKNGFKTVSYVNERML